MSFDNSADLQSASTPQEDTDLSAALSGSEAAFVTGESSKPPSTQYIILGGLLILAPIVIWIMYNRKGPASASAAVAKPPAAVQTVRTFLNSGPSGIKVMREMLQSTEKIVQEFLKYPTMTQVPLADLKTNPFRSAGANAPDPDAAARRKREEERAAVVKAVQNLQLQSIMSGTHKACMINNALYTEGQQVDQFTIERIVNGAVIVKSGQYRFELKMQR